MEYMKTRFVALIIVFACYSCVPIHHSSRMLECSIKVASLLGGDPPREVENLTDAEKRQFLIALENAKIADPPGGVSPSPKIRYVIGVACEGFNQEVYCDLNGNPFFASGDEVSKSKVAEYCRRIIAE